MQKYTGQTKLTKTFLFLLFSIGTVVFPYLAWFKLNTDIMGVRPLLFSLGALCTILFSFTFIKGKRLSAPLVFMGTHSGTMYLIHIFILYNLGDYIFRTSIPVIQYAVALGFTLLISVIIDYIRKVIRYDQLIQFLCRPFA